MQMVIWKKLRVLSEKLEGKILYVIKYVVLSKCESSYTWIFTTAYIANESYLSEENSCFFTIDIAAGEMTCSAICFFWFKDPSDSILEYLRRLWVLVHTLKTSKKT